jgi:hypothetical protein
MNLLRLHIHATIGERFVMVLCCNSVVLEVCGKLALRFESLLMALKATSVNISWQYSMTSSSRGLATVVSSLATPLLQISPL